MASILSLKAKLVEAPELKSVGKNNTSLATLKVAEDVRKKEGDSWKTVGTNFYEISVWGDKALDAQLLSVGDLLDFGAYETEEGKLRYRVKLEEQTWTYKGKDYSKLSLSAFDWAVINGDN